VARLLRRQEDPADLVAVAGVSTVRTLLLAVQEIPAKMGVVAAQAVQAVAARWALLVMDFCTALTIRIAAEEKAATPRHITHTALSVLVVVALRGVIEIPALEARLMEVLAGSALKERPRLQQALDMVLAVAEVVPRAMERRPSRAGLALTEFLRLAIQYKTKE
jgi:hypothetical protein